MLTFAQFLIESPSGVRGWMSPSGKVTYVPDDKEHEEHSPIKKYHDMGSIQRAGYVRFGHNRDSIHGGDVHYVHYDGEHPKGHATALKALQHMKPHHSEHVLIMRHPGHSGLVDRENRDKSHMMNYHDADEMKASDAYAHLRSQINQQQHAHA